MQYGELWEYKSRVETNKIHLSHFLARATVGEEKKGRKKRKKRKKKEKERKTKPRYVFVLKSWVFWIPKVLVWRLGPPLSRVLWKDHPNPRYLLR